MIPIIQISHFANQLPLWPYHFSVLSDAWEHLWVGLFGSTECNETTEPIVLKPCVLTYHTGSILR